MKMNEINTIKVISKISIYKDGKRENIAEIVENCGCGFTHLIRIHPDYVDSLALFNKCLRFCFPEEVYVTDYTKDESIKRGYFINNNNIAIIVDKII